MIEAVEITEAAGLDGYADVVLLAEAVRSLREEAGRLARALHGRKVWMVNSTARGGGVAEMLPKLVVLLNELGARTEWVVLKTDQREFFPLTKRIHNLLHGSGDPAFSEDDRQLYLRVSSASAAALKPHLDPDDVLVVHDPQPLGMGALLKRELGLPFIFRSHIGLDEDGPETRAGWEFLRPHAELCDYAIFSAREYIPDFLATKAGLITPAIDPLSDKNRELSPPKVVEILKNGGLVRSPHPVETDQYEEQAMRLGPSGRFAPMNEETEIGILFRPIVTQISRWDRLKGYVPLMDAFVRLKRGIVEGDRSYRQLRRLAEVRLVLAGPDPASVADDPEAQDVLGEVIEAYRRLPPWIQADVAVVSLPMGSRYQNALMVNALQRCSSVVVQNSLREGFGLTVTEAMWKQIPVLGSRACGIRQQIRDGLDGRLIDDCEDATGIAELLETTLDDLAGRTRWSRNAQRRVLDEFLIFTQLRRWLETLAKQLEHPRRDLPGRRS